MREFQENSVVEIACVCVLKYNTWMTDMYIVLYYHITPEGHSLWGTMLSYPILKDDHHWKSHYSLFLPWELQYNPSTKGIFLVKTSNLLDKCKDNIYVPWGGHESFAEYVILF